MINQKMSAKWQSFCFCHNVYIMQGIHLLIVAWWCHMASEIWVNTVQIMTCCLTAPSHYLNPCRLIIIEVLSLLGYSPEVNFTENAPVIYPSYEFENYQFKITAASPSGKWFKRKKTCLPTTPEPVFFLGITPPIEGIQAFPILGIPDVRMTITGHSCDLKLVWYMSLIHCPLGDFNEILNK